MRQNKGMSLVEIMIVVGIFAMMVLVVNGVIVSAQSMWSSSTIFSTLEEQALRISRQIAGDLEKSAMMYAPSGSGLSYTDLLPHVTPTGGNSTDGYFGDNITFLVPKFDANGQPQLKVTSNDISVDWLAGTIINFSLVTENGRTRIRRTSTSVGIAGSTETVDLTENATSLEFRDKDTDSKLAYFMVRWSFTLAKRSMMSRTYSVQRTGVVFLRNSRGAEDLY